MKENGDRCPDTYVAVEVQLVDGRCDLLIVSDRDDLQDVSDVVIQEAWGVRLAGELGWVRKRVDGTVERVLLHGKALRVDQVDLSGETGVTELFLERE